MNDEWTIVITIDDYRNVNWKREFANRVMETFCFEPKQVCEIRATEGLIEIDQPTWHIRGDGVITASIWPLNSKQQACGLIDSLDEPTHT